MKTFCCNCGQKTDISAFYKNSANSVIKFFFILFSEIKYIYKIIDKGVDKTNIFFYNNAHTEKQYVL